MTKKQTLYHKFLGLLSLFLIGIALVSCEAEKDISANPKVNNHEISFEQFKKETGLHDFNTNFHILSNVGLATSDAKTDELSDFYISTDIIKKL